MHYAIWQEFLGIQTTSTPRNPLGKASKTRKLSNRDTPLPSAFECCTLVWSRWQEARESANSALQKSMHRPYVSSLWRTGKNKEGREQYFNKAILSLECTRKQPWMYKKTKYRESCAYRHRLIKECPVSLAAVTSIPVGDCQFLTWWTILHCVQQNRVRKLSYHGVQIFFERM